MLKTSLTEEIGESNFLWGIYRFLLVFYASKGVGIVQPF